MSSIKLGEVRITFDDRGTGPALLFVHGHPFNRSMWRPQLEVFGQTGWRVVAPDLRGYGDSTVKPGKTLLSDFAHDLDLLLAHLDVERAVVAGLSMGGQIVMELYRLFPGRVAGLVLADTSARAETDQGKEDRYAAADRLEKEGMDGYAHEVLAKMVAPYNLDAYPKIGEHVLDMMLQTPAHGAAAALRGRAERPDYTQVLRDANVPTLIVVGKDDAFTPVSEADLMHREVKDSTLVVIDGAAHMPNLERPNDFNDALERFLTLHHCA